MLTIDRVKDMSNQELNTLVNGLCGWEHSEEYGWSQFGPDGHFRRDQRECKVPPEPATDLNAIHESMLWSIEKEGPTFLALFVCQLRRLVGSNSDNTEDIINTDARTRAMALVLARSDENVNATNKVPNIR